MYVVIESWTPKAAFLDASRQTRTDFFARLTAALDGSAAQGIRPLGWGRTDPAGEHGSRHAWFAVWETTDAAAADAFLGGVAASGWYEYFDQTNVRGELRPVGDVVDEHVAL